MTTLATTPPPGAPTLSLAQPTIKIIGYDANGLALENIEDNLSSLPSFLQKWSTVWVMIIGQVPQSKIDELFKQLNVDLVELSDVLNLNADPHVSVLHQNYLLLTHVYYYQPNEKRQQTSFYLGKQLLITVQTDANDTETMILNDLNKNISNIRESGPDFLLYRLLLLYLASYTRLVRALSTNIDGYESKLIINPETFSIENYFQLRKRLVVLKRNLWAQRDVMTQWVTFNNSAFSTKVVTPAQSVLFQQFPDRMSETIGLLDNTLAHCNGLLDIYFSLTSNQMNQIMKTLTIFSAIFLPLSFLAGLWGMNFDYNDSHWNMPELHMHYGYPIACLVMFSIAIGLVTIFYKVGWLQISFRKAQRKLMTVDSLDGSDS